MLGQNNTQEIIPRTHPWVVDGLKLFPIISNIPLWELSIIPIVRIDGIKKPHNPFVLPLCDAQKYQDGNC